MKNKMGLSVGIAVGSSLQIALFVAPVLVFFSYLFGQPMDLEFTLPEVVAVIVALHLIFQINGDGEMNWLEGVQLLSVYLILGILFFYLPERAHEGLNAIDVRSAVQLDQCYRVSASALCHQRSHRPAPSGFASNAPQSGTVGAGALELPANRPEMAIRVAATMPTPTALASSLVPERRLVAFSARIAGGSNDRQAAG